MTFGERLNVTRKQQGRTAQEVANVLGIGLRSYRAYESGNREPSFFFARAPLLIFWTCLLIICCAAMNFSQKHAGEH